MATIGSQLTTPDQGWKRYDDTHPAIKYASGLSKTSNTSYYNGTTTGGNLTGQLASFRFIGTKIRLIDPSSHTNRTKDSVVKIDGVEHTFSIANSSGLYQVLVFEVSSLSFGEHTVDIINNDGMYIFFDAIDIDETGRLLHPDEVLTPDELDVGKRIRAHYTATSNAVGTFSGLGEETYVDGINDFIPPSSSATPNGDFYFIMVDDINEKKKLIADRNIQHSISWETLNNEGIASGSGLPTLLKVNPNNLTATASSEYDSNHTAYFTLDGDVDSKWLAMDTTSGWIKVELQESKIVKMYTVQAWSNTSTGHTRAPKDWTFEGSNDDVNWDILDIRIGETWQPSEKKNFKIDNDKLSGYKYYRLNISNNNGNSDLSVGEWELYESFDDFAFTTRLLTGGISSTDKDNEWDNYIVNSTLDGTVTAGDNNIWNGNLASWSSSTGANGNRMYRGGNNALTIQASGYSSSTAGAQVGFRPVLEIESIFVSLNKSFILFNGEYKNIVAGVTEVLSRITEDVILTMTSYTSPSGVASASSEYSSSYPAWYAFNGVIDLTNRWMTSTSVNYGWLKYDFGKGNEKCIGKYSITSMDNDTNTQNPKDWTFEGSNDGENWTVLDTQTNITNWTKSETKDFSFENNTSYQMYRLNISSNQNPTSALSVTGFNMTEITPYIPSTPPSWKTISTTIPSVETFQEEGMDDFSTLSRKEAPFKQDMTVEIVDEGKLFKTTIDLKKYFDIKGFNVK